MEIPAVVLLLGADRTSPEQMFPVPVVPSCIIGHRQLPICRASISRADYATVRATANVARKKTVRGISSIVLWDRSALWGILATFAT